MGCCWGIFLRNQYTYDSIPERQVGPEYNVVDVTNTDHSPRQIKKNFLSLYVLGDYLGSGSFSVVRRGIEMNTGAYVAVKIIAKYKVGRGSHLERLKSEVRILRRLDHPGIIKFKTFVSEGPYFYLVTELVTGGELFDQIVKRTHYNEGLGRRIVTQILQALDYLHIGMGVVHRDIKPENILMTSGSDDAQIKLADFGFATHVVDISEQETPLGTPAYVSPEILRAEGRYGTACDIWSCGVVCYILLCGCHPFQEDAQEALFAQVMAGDYDFHESQWSQVSPSAVNFVGRMLVVDPGQRWSAAQLLQHPWVQVIDTANDCGCDDNLTGCLEHLRRYTAHKKMKRMLHAVVAAHRFNLATVAN